MRHFTKQFTRIAITLVMSLICLTSSADVVNTGKIFNHRPEYIPTQFTVNNQSVLFLKEELQDEDGDWTGQYKFTFFDASFNEQSSFTTPAFAKVTAKTYSSYVEGHYNVQEVGSNDELKVENVSEETFTDYCYERGFGCRQDKGNEIWITAPYCSEYYYCYYEFDDQYPTLIYVYRDGNIYERSIEYSSDIVYSEPSLYIESDFPDPQDIDLVSSNNYQTESFELTQTLFNNDAAFEWIIPSYTLVDVLEVYERGKTEGQEIVTNGFKVISQNGSTLADIAIPDSNSRYLDFDLYQTEAGSFLFVRYDVKTDEGYNEEYYQLYKIESESSLIEPVGAPRKVGVSPTTPHRGTPVNVSLGEPVDNGSKLTVVSVAGRTAFVQDLKPGSTEAVIDTNRLERGVYVVVVDDGKTKREATKIVVR